MKTIRIISQPSLMLLAIITVFIFSCNEAQEKNKATEPQNTSSETVSPQQKTIPDKNKLVGEWTRTDASYQIKITELLDDGTMKAGYFNPTSINVGQCNVGIC